MSKSVMMVGAMVVAFSYHAALAAAPSHKPYTMLWNQNGNFGGSVNSQNYEPSMVEYDDAAADDFVVPSGQIWAIGEVDVTGTYINGSGPAASVVITIYREKHEVPWRGRKGPYTLNCTDNNGSFQCMLPTNAHGRPSVKIVSGHYGISVVANCDSTTCGQWNWMENTTVTGYQAAWENPGGAQNIPQCHGFEPLNTCFAGSPADLAFDLQGNIE